jgi:hypothetical protein
VLSEYEAKGRVHDDARKERRHGAFKNVRKITPSYIELYFRQTQPYTNELSDTTYILEFIGKIVQLRYMCRVIEASEGARLGIC